MKITAVLGSPHQNGNTSTLAREVLKGAATHGASVEEIFLADKNIGFCRGCISLDLDNMCMSTGRCNINDDVNDLREKLYNSDGIVLASPAYGIMPTARMKNFMVDRIGMLTAYTSGLGGKYFVGISTAGGIGARKVARDLPEHFLSGFFLRSYLTGTIHAHLAYDSVSQKTELLDKAYRMGEKLIKDIQNRKKYPFQKMFTRTLNRLMVRKIITGNIYQNRERQMKAVYQNLVERKLISPAP
jgi:multimeric flavodoxin WrbA